MYTYPEALDAMEKIIRDLFRAAGFTVADVSVVADSVTGTASVIWTRLGKSSVEATIRMPVIPAQRKLSAQEFVNYAGLALHEVGHPLFTDKATWEHAVANGQSRLLNALEDVRIEKLLIESGIAANAMAVLADLVRVLDYKALDAKFDPNDPCTVGFVMAFLGRAQNGYPMDASLMLRKLNPGGKVSRVLTWALPELAACRSTQDCLDLATRIIAALPKKDKQPRGPKGEQPKGPKGEQGEAKGEQGEAKGEQGEQGEAKGKAGEQGEAKGEQGEAKGEQGEAKGEQGEAKGEAKGEQGEGSEAGGTDAGDGGALSDRDIQAVDFTPKLGEEMLPKGDAGKARFNTVSKVIRGIREASRQAGNKLPKVKPGEYTDQMVGLAAAKATRLRANLAAAMRKNEQDLFEGGLNRGRLDRRSFGRMVTGSVNVFGKREMTDGYETDCVVLVDGSGSMSGGNILAASVMALVVAQAAAQVGVVNHTYIFGGSWGSGSLREVHAGKGKPDAKMFGRMPNLTGGGTPLCSSMLAVALKQVARAPAKRRMLFVVSDGICNQGPEALKGVAAYIEQAMGTEVANLSIGMPLQGLFSTEAYVDPKQDIAAAGLQALTRKLTVAGA